MVPKISLGSPIIKACRPHFQNTVFDVKLGVIEPEHRIAEFVKAGADVISVHPEVSTTRDARDNHPRSQSEIAESAQERASSGAASPPFPCPLQSTLQLTAVLDEIAKAGCAPGVVLNPATPISSVF